MRQFGTPTPANKYIDRPSAYGVVFNARDYIFCVEHHGRYFLPGGGIDDGENAKEALAREFIEETGFAVRIGEIIGGAGEFVDIPAENVFVNKIGRFYLCEFINPGHLLSKPEYKSLWISVDEFRAGAAHESHVWAITTAQQNRP
ncbi:MAG: NUDIX domain-containing protein [Candidatus Zixiibacteriota bacterium]